MIELRIEELENINSGNWVEDISSAAGDVYNTLSNASTGSEIGAGAVAGAIWNYC